MPESTKELGPARSPPSRKRSLPRRLLRAAGIVLAVPVVLILAVLVWLHTGSGQAFVRGKVHARLAQRINGTVEIGQLDFALLGAITLGGVVIKDDTGSEAISLDSLRIVPGWRSLLSGAPVIESVTLRGLHVHLRQDADGGSNLKRLVKPTPPTPPSKPSPPSKTRIQVRSIAISDVDVSVEKPDGTRIGLSNLAIDASVDAVPGTKTFQVSVPRIGADISLDKPEGALSLAVSHLETGVSVALENGAGKISLARTKAHARILQKGAEPRETDLDLAGIDLAIADGGLEATLDQLLVGALVLQSLEVKGKAADGALVGEQKVSVIGLHVDAGRLNTLLQKQLVASDVDIETRLTGPPERIVVATTVKTAGGNLGLDGTVDVSNPTRPGYDLTLIASAVGTERLLLPGSSTAPKVESKSLRVAVKGRGASKEDAEADITLELGPTTIGKLVIDEATLEARLEKGQLTIKKLVIKTLAQKVELTGKVDLSKRHVHGQLSLVGDVGVALSRARAAGIPVKASIAPGTAVIREGDLTVDVDGDLDGVLAVDVAAKRIALAGGSVAANAHVELVKKEPGPDGKKYEPRALSATVDINDLDLVALAELRGKKLANVGGTVSGKVKVGGTVAEPNVDYAVRVQAHSAIPMTGFFKTSSLVVDLEGKANKHKIDAELTAKRDDGMKLLGATVQAPLLIDGAHKGLSPREPLHIKLDIPRRSFDDYLALVPKPILLALGKKVPRGEIEAHVDVTGTAEHPTGTFDVALDAGALADKKQRLHLEGKITDEGGSTVVASHASAWLDAEKSSTLEAEATAKLSRSPLVPGPREVEWTLDAKVPPVALAELPLPPEKLAGLSGNAGAVIKAHGNASDAYADVAVDLTDVKKGEAGPLGAHVGVKVEPETTHVDVGVTLAGKPLLKTTGNVGVAGKGLIAKARAKALGDPTLALDVDIPRRPIADLAPLRPKLAAVPGEISGHGAIRGTVAVPTGDGGLAYDGFTTVAGGPGRAGVELHADAGAVRAQVALGAPQGGTAPVRIDAELPRGALAGYRAGEGTLPVAVSARAEAVDLRTLVPSYAPRGGAEVAGRLDWNMNGKLALEKTDRGARLATGALDGRFEITHGKIALPNTKRTLEDVELRLASDASALRIESISARESDLDKPDRRIGLKGQLGWHDLHPDKLTLDIQAKDWLLFGSEKLGPADAPRGALTADIGVAAELGGPTRRVTADVRSLDLQFPERFARAHQPEVTSLGDVVFVDQASVPAGKLPRVEPPKAAIATEAEQEGMKGKVTETAPPPAEEEASGLDVRVHVPKPIHVNQAPLDVWAQGDIHAVIGQGSKRVEGKLDVVRGNLMLGGKRHDLEQGAITFDEKNPGGWMDLHFARTLPPSTARDISQASAGGDKVRIDMVGPIGKQKVTMRGAGNAYLYDVLAVNNVGRVRVYSQPDMPASESVQIPQPDGLLGLTYMAINLPHNLYFEHFNAWSDPYDDPRAYGRVQHMETEHDSESGKTRVRVVSRPHAAGQNSSELQLDYLFTNTSRALFGAGLRGGERAGGGPGLFFEWSSED